MALNQLKDLYIAVIGGDTREVILAGELAALGAHVFLYGFEKYETPVSGTIRNGLPEYADALILPLPGILDDGSVYATFSEAKIYPFQFQQLLQPGVLVLGGRFRQQDREHFCAHKVKVFETLNLPELNVYNAIPTAEGALAFAIQQSQITIHGSKTLVTGFGRCAQPLARLLKALGAEVTVAVRKQEALASARTLGMYALKMDELQDHSNNFQFIFNTIPDIVITSNILAKSNRDVLIIDIASAPGGVDFHAAKKLGRNAYLLAGIPGKTAPVTAGKILADVYPYYISLHKKGGEMK